MGQAHFAFIVPNRTNRTVAEEKEALAPYPETDDYE